MSEVNEKLRADEERAANIALDGLTKVIEEFDEYYRWLDKAHQGSLNEQAIDVRKRIVQTHLILRLLNTALSESRSINALADEAGNAAEGSSDEWAVLNARVAAFQPHMKRQSELMELIELYSDVFYWVAGLFVNVGEFCNKFTQALRAARHAA